MPVLMGGVQWRLSKKYLADCVHPNPFFKTLRMGPVISSYKPTSNVILFFYCVYDLHPVCTKGITQFNTWTLPTCPFWTLLGFFGNVSYFWVFTSSVHHYHPCHTRMISIGIDYRPYILFRHRPFNIYWCRVSRYWSFLIRLVILSYCKFTGSNHTYFPFTAALNSRPLTIAKPDSSADVRLEAFSFAWARWSRRQDAACRECWLIILCT